MKLFRHKCFWNQKRTHEQRKKKTAKRNVYYKSLGVRDFWTHEGIMTLEVKKRWREKDWQKVKTDQKNMSVTGFGSTGVCYPSAHPWLGGRLYQLHCSLENHHVQICLIFASETQYGRFLWEKTDSVKRWYVTYKIHSLYTLCFIISYSSYLWECS